MPRLVDFGLDDLQSTIDARDATILTQLSTINSLNDEVKTLTIANAVCAAEKNLLTESCGCPTCEVCEAETSSGMGSAFVTTYFTLTGLLVSIYLIE